MTVITAMTMIGVYENADETMAGQAGFAPHWISAGGSGAPGGSGGPGDGDPGGPGRPGGPGGPGDGDGDDDGRTDLITKTRPKTKKPSLYKVLILNDDYTPMEFVIEVLERFFGFGNEDATRVMLHVHHKGAGICGVFTYEIAETKVTQVSDYARQNQHPLQCVMEKE